MANGKIRFGKQLGGELSLIIPDGVDNTEVIVPESGTLTTKEYVDSEIVKLTKNQTIPETNTSSSNIAGNAGTATKLQTARTINGVSFDGSSNITVSDSTAVKLTGNETIAGIKTFSSSPIVPTPTAATQAANKAYVDSTSGVTFTANDSRAKTALNASGNAPIYACRAWVNFNGTGTVAIRASGNVSSIIDNGVGNYTVRFTAAMTDANYSAVATTGNFNLSSTQTATVSSNVFSSSSYSYRTFNINGTIVDLDAQSISIFR